ncbi:MAG: methionyl-tRNA formyltransferase [Casimicrobiaceae bacterium]
MEAAFRVGFAGTPPFAAAALRALLGAGFDVALVLTRPDAPQGRGMKLSPSAVKAVARARGIPVLQPARLKDEPECAALTAHELDVLVVAAYGLILPARILAWPRHGCINIHASLLPRWRGAAPIQRALLAGDARTGVSIMQMDPGLDTGPVILERTVAIAPRENAATLHDKLADSGGEAIVTALARLRTQGRLDVRAQPAEGATYAAKIDRKEATIDWSGAAIALDRQIRAFNPAPGAQTKFVGEVLKIWDAEPVVGRFGAPGTIARADAGGIIVACGDGALVVRELQRAGARRLPVAAFVAGHPIAPGTTFG